MVLLRTVGLVTVPSTSTSSPMIWTEPPPFSRWVYTFSTFWWHCGWLRQGEAGGEGVELRKRQTGLVPCVADNSWSQKVVADYMY